MYSPMEASPHGGTISARGRMRRSKRVGSGLGIHTCPENMPVHAPGAQHRKQGLGGEQGKDCEMWRLSWIVQVSPECNHERPDESEILLHRGSCGDRREMLHGWLWKRKGNELSPSSLEGM